mmetsp:Transcript_11876/g.20008  ORF Transcript_11876/g.20008 Transcript_11876/m.20008 type:complete len:430 (+) Transcript_11876:161-1450(+)|eukprot:CAMPEP_0119334730 /NCGR_PEP_ID=MMETSP1333-20130426/87942_1 /TAXON_ID=418940 /ORGANISM="Scyphosphaera apsteinii, Strain RCC1455" /LENGTH=429 /DNA_ID=CAMNT_0007345099 /DNA_START=159 /DNA_END=1448 /DNA_ORIENTATION=+
MVATQYRLLVLLSAMHTPPARALPPLYALRSGAHSGSLYFSALLSSAGWSTFFQFGGLCDGTPPNGHPNPNASEASKALLDNFRHGCGCGHDHVFGCNAANQPQCAKKNPLCTGHCNHTCLAGGAVAVVAAPLGKVRQEQEEALRLTFAHRPDARLVTFTRTNVVKHALSKMKSSCLCRALNNHGSTADLAFVVGQPCFVHVPPALLLSRAANIANNAATLVSTRDFGGVPVAHHVVYEEVQQDATDTIDAMLRSINASAPSQRRAGVRQMSTPFKLTSDDLSKVLLDFAPVNATFRAWPCLHTQLLSTRAERAEPCHVEPKSLSLIRHEHKSMAGYELVAYPKFSGMAITCHNNNVSEDDVGTLVESSSGEQSDHRASAPERTSSPVDSWQRALCRAAQQKRRRLLGAEGPVDVCLICDQCNVSDPNS